jgi:hypothetical protein
MLAAWDHRFGRALPNLFAYQHLFALTVTAPLSK